jgi:hypothetical protein
VYTGNIVPFAGVQLHVGVISRRYFCLAGIAHTACRSVVFGPDRIAEVFSGFVYVGAFPERRGKPLLHGSERIRLPRTLDKGLNYVWHLDTDLNFEDLACRVFPDRLSKSGAQLLARPRSWRDMAIPNLGNPWWAIKFKVGNSSYTLENRYDGRRAATFAVARSHHSGGPDPRIDDYILKRI